MPSLVVNGRDMADFGFTVRDHAEGAIQFAQRRGGLPVLARRGWARSGAVQHDVAERTQVGRIHAASASALRAQAQALIGWCEQAGLAEVRTGLMASDRLFYGELVGATFKPVRAAEWIGVGDVTLKWQVPSPVQYEVGYRQYGGVAGERVTISLGDLESAYELYLLGAATNPQFTIRNATGAIVGGVAITYTLAATDFITVNADAGRVRKTLSGVTTDADSVAAAVAPGNDPFALLVPSDGDWNAGVGLTVEVSTGSFLLRVRRVFYL